MYGLHIVSQDQSSVIISDASRTMVDLLIDPALGGGISAVVRIFTRYLKSDQKNLELLFDYAKRTYNGAVLKRLGFLLERVAPEERNIIKLCKYGITSGYVKLDPKLGADQLITRWNLWVPIELESIL
jgi:predicted transcriptional regulator of viral defense system